MSSSPPNANEPRHTSRDPLLAELHALRAELKELQTRRQPRWQRWAMAGAVATLPVAAMAFDPGWTAFGAGQPILAGEMNSRFEAIRAAIDGLDARFIDTDLTLGVGTGQPHASIQDALESLATRRIASNAIVTIQVANGVYNSDTITAEHPDGSRIEILGNRADRSRVELRFTSGSPGLVVGAGHALRRFDGFTLVGGEGAPTEGEEETYDEYNLVAGVAVRNGSYAAVGPHLMVTRFGIGFLSADNSVLVGEGESDTEDAKVTALANLGRGFDAQFGGVLHASHSVSELNWDGYATSRGGVVQAEQPNAKSNFSGGAWANANGTILFRNPTITDSRSGLVAARMGLLHVEGGYVQADSIRDTIFRAHNAGFLKLEGVEIQVTNPPADESLPVYGTEGPRGELVSK